jgi:hypothetical protein
MTSGNIGMDQGLVDSLAKSNTFSPLDLHFAKLMAGLSANGKEDLFLAAALASHYHKQDSTRMGPRQLATREGENLLDFLHLSPKYDKNK